jgi:hypothetical protein
MFKGGQPHLHMKKNIANHSIPQQFVPPTLLKTGKTTPGG